MGQKAFCNLTTVFLKLKKAMPERTSVAFKEHSVAFCFTFFVYALKLNLEPKINLKNQHVKMSLSRLSRFHFPSLKGQGWFIFPLSF